jgi:ribosome-associated translation inhibitor RaiA
MQVLFESREPDAARLRDLAERRVRFVMRRLTWLVPRAHVRMTDINGPRGGVDKRVQLELRTEAGGTIVVTSVARDWRSALDGALARAARSIVRMWRRARSHPRAPRHPWPAGT